MLVCRSFIDAIHSEALVAYPIAKIPHTKFKKSGWRAGEDTPKYSPSAARILLAEKAKITPVASWLREQSSFLSFFHSQTSSPAYRPLNPATIPSPVRPISLNALQSCAVQAHSRRLPNSVCTGLHASLREPFSVPNTAEERLTKTSEWQLLGQRGGRWQSESERIYCPICGTGSGVLCCRLSALCAGSEPEKVLCTR